MPNIKVCKRLCKRILLSNLLVNDYTIALTPLLSGRHGVGKSQVACQIAKDLNGVCITIEGGTLKEGEITGIPYQYKNINDEIEFKFLPYYAIDRIQKAEKLINNEHLNDGIESILEGSENKYSNNNLNLKEKISLIKSGKIKPVILFFDEINRTDLAVFRELMNIILTRTVNGYKLPWWCFIIAAMNPSTTESTYITNEIDPAQLDRFFKLNVKEDVNEWLIYAAENNYDKSIIEFILNHREVLTDNKQELDDLETSTPSPRGWSMINLILQAKDNINVFFDSDELQYIDSDINQIITAKVGNVVASMYQSNLKEPSKLVLAEDVYDLSYDGLDDDIVRLITNQSTARNSLTSKSLTNYLKKKIESIIKDNTKYTRLLFKTTKYMNLLDQSSRLFFVKNLGCTKTKSNRVLIEYLIDVVDEGLIELLENSNDNKEKIVGKKYGHYWTS